MDEVIVYKCTISTCINKKEREITNFCIDDNELISTILIQHYFILNILEARVLFHLIYVRIMHELLLYQNESNWNIKTIPLFSVERFISWRDNKTDVRIIFEHLDYVSP